MTLLVELASGRMAAFVHKLPLVSTKKVLFGLPEITLYCKLKLEVE